MNEQTTSRFSNRDELEQIRGYRRLNAPAILAFILGICSAGALMHLNLWIVPFFAVLVGVLGLVLARRNDDMGGLTPAWLGIAMALLFASWAASQFYVSRAVIYKEAEVVARDWLNLVLAGEDEMAHQAMLHPATRQSTGLSVDDYYAMDEAARKAKDRFFAEPPVSELLALGTNAKIELIENITQDVDLQYAKLIRQVYRITAPNKEPIEAMLSITRSYKEDLGRATWIVAEVGYPDKTM